jgi:hypothetical protein
MRVVVEVEGRHRIYKSLACGLVIAGWCYFPSTTVTLTSEEL